MNPQLSDGIELICLFGVIWFVFIVLVFHTDKDGRR